VGKVRSEKKGRMDAAQRIAAAQLIASLIVAQDQDLGETLRFAEDQSAGLTTSHRE
jgi:hypothetical protein